MASGLSGGLLVAAAAWALGGLLVGWLRLRRTPAPTAFAPPRGHAGAGVRYELTEAFAPWAKESARLHLPSYLAGVFFHLAVFTALGLAVGSLVPGLGPRLVSLGWPVRVVLLLGLFCGLGLLVKRLTSKRMRALSVPEDYLANLLGGAMVAAALIALSRPTWLHGLHLVTAALLLYLPLGKLRHVIHLVVSRLYLGRGLGRRAVLPTARGAGA